MSAPPISTTPLVTVIALCFNHERFVVECLESIRAQTFQNFELIVTDDCSKDNSPEIIAEWLTRNYPQAKYIRHKENAGLCRTLNEAIASANAEFISMIATDDIWESHKIQSQLEKFSTLSSETAVVYSDAFQIDEAGNLLSTLFIENHRPNYSPFSGYIFSDLAYKNFIPAMATMIRREAILNVGGYDERLGYEDWDMWLRLSLKWRFAFIPEPLARYRIVATSMARTLLVNYSATRSVTNAIISEKCLASGKLTTELVAYHKTRLQHSAYELYVNGDRRAAKHLLEVFRWTKNLRYGLLGLLASVGVSRQRIKRLEYLFLRKN
jgi:glycosyltransferase involved in cell wall biosynthesis